LADPPLAAPPCCQVFPPRSLVGTCFHSELISNSADNFFLPFFLSQRIRRSWFLLLLPPRCSQSPRGLVLFRGSRSYLLMSETSRLPYSPAFPFPLDDILIEGVNDFSFPDQITAFQFLVPPFAPFLRVCFPFSPPFYPRSFVSLNIQEVWFLFALGLGGTPTSSFDFEVPPPSISLLEFHSPPPSRNSHFFCRPSGRCTLPSGFFSDTLFNPCLFFVIPPHPPFERLVDVLADAFPDVSFFSRRLFSPSSSPFERGFSF